MSILNNATTYPKVGDLLISSGNNNQTPMYLEARFEYLVDVPHSFNGQAGKVVTVNNNEDGLEFTTGTPGATGPQGIPGATGAPGATGPAGSVSSADSVVSTLIGPGLSIPDSAYAYPITDVNSVTEGTKFLVDPVNFAIQNVSGAPIRCLITAAIAINNSAGTDVLVLWFQINSAPNVYIAETGKMVMPLTVSDVGITTSVIVTVPTNWYIQCLTYTSILGGVTIQAEQTSFSVVEI
jgi:hypothetical protein